MKAAIVTGAGRAPVLAEFADPAPQDGEHLITITAAALSQITRSRASGSHYSDTASFPFVVGIDGVGRLDDGARVYFVKPSAPHGGMAERTIVPAARCVALPDDLDDITAAAIANPGMSSWAALTERARIRPGESVLINGATGTSGRLAVQIARHLGAGRIIATGRNPAALGALGADATILLSDDDAALDNAFGAQIEDGIDIVLDYLWGRSATRLLATAARTLVDGRRLRFVQIGSVSGGEIALPAAVLRAAAIEMLGSGLGSVPFDRLISVIGELLRASTPAGLSIATRILPLSEIAHAWSATDDHRRIVLTPG